MDCCLLFPRTLVSRQFDCCLVIALYTVSRCPVILDGLAPGDCCLVIPSYTVLSRQFGWL